MYGYITTQPPYTMHILLCDYAMPRDKKGVQKDNYERRRRCFDGLSPYQLMEHVL